MGKKIKILQTSIGTGNFGGVPSFSYNLAKAISKEKFSVDFLSIYKSSYTIVNDNFKKMGWNDFELGISYKGLLNKIRIYLKVKHFLRNHHYNIIHINSGSSLFCAIVGLAARRARVDKVIIHSHSCLGCKSKLKRIANICLKNILPDFSDIHLACSDAAASDCFKKKIIKSGSYKVIHDGIDVERFKFSNTERNRIRKKYELENSNVILQIGRFDPVKNQKFSLQLLKAVNESLNNKKKAKLIFIGSGPTKQTAERYAIELGIINDVMFINPLVDVEKIMNAADILLFPSLSEGFGMVAVEAQCNGLPVVASTGVSNETKITDIIHYLNLNTSLSNWVKLLLKSINPTMNRAKYATEIQNSDYSLTKMASAVEEIYEKR